MNKKKNNRLAVVILASGASERFGDSTPKQYQKINNKTILEYSIEKFIKSNKINSIYIAYNKKHKKYILPIKKKFKTISFILGGTSRQSSALKVLNFIYRKKLYRYVLIHDSVRPFVTISLVNKVINKLMLNKGVIPAIQINDSIKVINKKKVVKNLDRSNVFVSQTPQGFILNNLIEAYKKIEINKLHNYTDDAQIFVDAGFRVDIIKGESSNFKITEKNDFNKAKKMYSNDSLMKVGQGLDVHAFTAGKNFKLFGINIPYNKSIKAHSDGDVGVHALIDAILGTLSVGDIGTHFPDNDKKYKNINSLSLLKKTIKILQKNKGEIVHIDNTVVCEKPKINKYISKMRKVIADFLELDIKSVSIKATTTEKLGFIGRNDGIAVFSIATINFYYEK